LKLGIFTPVFGNLSAEQMLVEVRKYERVSAIELGTGGRLVDCEERRRSLSTVDLAAALARLALRK
jgi:hypothetical protein